MPATCLEHSVRKAAVAFVRQIGNLSHQPEVRDSLLKTAVHEVAWQLLDEFGDHYRLAEQLEIMSRLAGLGPEAFHAAGLAGHRSESLATARPRTATGQRPNGGGASGSPAISPRSRQLDNAALAELDC